MRLVRIAAILTVGGVLAMACHPEVACHLWAGGVFLSVENASTQTVQDIEVTYHGGKFRSEHLLNGQKRRKALGRIGEANTFDVEWHGATGATHQASFGVYFDGLFYDAIRIKLLPNGQAILIYRGHIYDNSKRTTKSAI